MKKIYLFFICIGATATLLGQTIKREFIIENIYKESGSQIIIMNHNDTLYKVTNAQYAIPYSKCDEKIEIGGKYKLMIEQIYPTKEMSNMFYSLRVSAVNGIAIEDKYHNTIYKTKNLIGLCIIGENN